ncbi:uncharacterized protein LOC110732103 [Chenopodium quinoa]|uniref:uncharacterized protein LOC110732103 n=1 Tax=Chenopodium quinoa TaxID=63459 RepID=UPI000B797453|nr:uncharacterized protein LOC110732103 [Chenopodium quinoa]
MLLEMQDGQLRRGLKAQFALRFEVHKSTITRVFDDLKKQMSEENVIDVRNKKLGTCGRKSVEYSDEFLQSVPLYKRTTERSYAAALKLSHVTIQNLKKRVGDPTFVNMQETIHIDEKWFWLNPETRRFYLLLKEENPYRRQQSRRFKIKAMFLAVVGKPLYDANKNLLHDGKYGIFPFVLKKEH